MSHGCRYLVWVLLVAATLAAFAIPASAANCDATPCFCGDTITISRTLTSAVDPVVGGQVCTGTGLNINGSNLTLTTSGQMNGLNNGTPQTAIVVAPGSTNVAINFVRISGFATGVSALNVTDNNYTDLLIMRTRTAAVDVSGDGNTVRRSEVKGTGGFGIRVVGDDAVVFLNRVENYTNGIIVLGDEARIDRNLVYRTTTGIHVEGTGASMNLNSVKTASGHGIELVGGGGHTLDRNISSQNGGDGFRTTPGPAGPGTGSVLTRNTGSADGGVGFRDTTVGGGTAGTGNTYSLNKCSATVGHKSAPLGLCK